jgi:hypothetical protein
MCITRSNRDVASKSPARARLPFHPGSAPESALLRQEQRTLGHLDEVLAGRAVMDGAR